MVSRPKLTSTTAKSKPGHTAPGTRSHTHLLVGIQGVSNVGLSRTQYLYHSVHVFILHRAHPYQHPVTILTKKFPKFIIETLPCFKILSTFQSILANQTQHILFKNQHNCHHSITRPNYISHSSIFTITPTPLTLLPDHHK